MAWLVLPDDAEDAQQHRVAADEAIAEKDLDLAIATLLCQGDHATQAFEQFVAGDHRPGVEIVDPGAEHDLDEAVDVAERPVHRQRHDPAAFEPAAEHHVVLALVGPVALDRRDQLDVVGRARADGFEHPVDRGIAAVFVVDVNRPQHVEIAAAERGKHALLRR